MRIHLNEQAHWPESVKAKTLVTPLTHFRSARVVLAAGLAITALPLITGCNSSNPINAANPSTTNTAPAPPQPATVTKRDIVDQVALNGEIIVPPSARADILPPFRATVEKVEKTVGAPVIKGDTLAQLALPSAEAWHEQTKAALKQAETDYANAEQQYKPAVVAAQKQVDAARAAAKADSQNRTITNQPDGSVTTTTTTPPDAAPTTDLATAEAALKQAQADMAANLLSVKQRLEEARANNSLARAGEKQGNVRSPINGTVITLNAQPGKEVGVDARQPVATVVDLSAIQVQATMDAGQASFVKTKMDANLTFDEVPGKTFTGTVEQITTDPKTKQFVAVIQFKNSDAQVKPGMHPHVGIKTGKSAQNALSVPAAAVDTDGSGKRIVNIQRDGKWVATPVEVGASDGQYTEIKTGVNENDTVQVTP